MIDRIHGIPGIQNIRKSAGKQQKPAQSGQKDGVEFSSFARELGKAAQELRKVPEVRTEKVEALQRQINSGTYRPDTELIARRMLQAGLRNAGEE
ncbi:MAG: flagellar biosynthesis anti-sigma factor FlgM [Synergistales bacterium]|nr:flagellar biosynthesis anti-sigma factor FlgM [Synergistales bacterium]